MEKVIRVSESDYQAIMRFEDDGGAAVDIAYEISPDNINNPPQDKPENKTMKLFVGATPEERMNLRKTQMFSS